MSQLYVMLAKLPLEMDMEAGRMLLRILGRGALADASLSQLCYVWATVALRMTIAR